MPLNFAHRGSLTEAPENTLPAFQKAIDHGAQAIELDVQLTKDDHLVVAHDHQLNRLNSDASGMIRDYPLSKLQSIDIGTHFNTMYQGTSIPTLEEVLAICPGDILLNIEIKNIPVIYEGIEQILLNTLEKWNRLEHVIVSSFDHVALQTVQAINPDMDLGMLFYYRILSPWTYAANSGLNIRSLHPNHVYVTQTFVQKSKQAGFEIYPFTVNDQKRYGQLLEYGVDGVFSNSPEIFK